MAAGHNNFSIVLGYTGAFKLQSLWLIRKDWVIDFDWALRARESIHLSANISGIQLDNNGIIQGLTGTEHRRIDL